MPLLAANLISTHHDLALSLCLITQKIDRCSRHQGQRMRTLSDLNHTINSRHLFQNGWRNNWLFKHDLKSECLTDRTKFSGTIGDKDGRKRMPGDAKASRGSKATCIVLYSSPRPQPWNHHHVHALPSCFPKWSCPWRLSAAGAHTWGPGNPCVNLLYSSTVTSGPNIYTMPLWTTGTFWSLDWRHV